MVFIKLFFYYVLQIIGAPPYNYSMVVNEQEVQQMFLIQLDQLQFKPVNLLVLDMEYWKLEPKCQAVIG